jgi:hypothetical protein
MLNHRSAGLVPALRFFRRRVRRHAAVADPAPPAISDGLRRLAALMSARSKIVTPVYAHQRRVTISYCA